MLLQEARALELLANETDLAAAHLQEYWQLAADLLVLVSDIEALEQTAPSAPEDAPQLLALRRRLREISSRLAALALE
jgi:glutamate 5-kinase